MFWQPSRRLKTVIINLLQVRETKVFQTENVFFRNGWTYLFASLKLFPNSQ